jgi:hypothetical protein
VGTTVVERKNFPFVQAKQQWAILASHYHHSALLQFGQGRRVKIISEMGVSGIHRGRETLLARKAHAPESAQLIAG